MIKRRQSKELNLGGVRLGGDAPVIVQSMTSTDTRNVEATVGQIKALEGAGCEIVRVAVIDEQAVASIGEICRRISIPLIADIHFDYRLALKVLEQGVSGIRINPGNIGRYHIKEIVNAAKERDVVIRLGINAGSLEREILKKHGGKPTSTALVESALRNIELFENIGFTNFKLSLKSSDVLTTIEAYREIAKRCPYPLHLGVTEAGTIINATIKSALGIGILLLEGIGDTIRVSIAGDPISEVRVAYGILRALGIRYVGPDIIACPTCGRTEINVVKIAEELERRLARMKKYIKIAIMGCVVNGPGEARDADIGLAGGRGFGYLFRKGERIRKIKETEFIDGLMEEIKKITEDS